MPRTATAEATLIPEEVQKELVLLRGLRDLNAERVGYAMGKSALSKERSNATAEHRKAVTEARKFLKDNIETFVAKGDVEGYKRAVEAKEKAQEALNKASAPYNEKISPLAKAIKYIDNIAIPTFLVTLGVEPKPTFAISEWVANKLEEEKKRKRSKSKKE
jgi:hypothetical protein